MTVFRVVIYPKYRKQYIYIYNYSMIWNSFGHGGIMGQLLIGYACIVFWNLIIEMFDSIMRGCNIVDLGW